MRIALQILQIHVEDHSVLYMKTNGEPDVICVTVIIKRFLAHRHVSNIKESGINMLRIIHAKAFIRMLQRPGESLPWQPATHVNLQAHDEPTPEMQRKTILVHPVFIVWKQYVLHVAQ